MNGRVAWSLAWLMLAAWLVQGADAQKPETVKLELLSGLVLEGTPISFLDSGLVVRRPDGILAERVPWTNFAQSALTILLKKYKHTEPFVAHLIEEENEEDPLPQEPRITLKPVPRLARPDPKAGLGAIVSNPLGLTVSLLIYLASLYAGYEIARYRNYHPALVCGIAAVAPIIGPILFLCLPTYFEEPPEEEPEPETQEPIALQSHAPMVPDPGGEDATPAPASPGGPAGPLIYKRPQITFNRRFFETKLVSFLKVVPNEAERDLVVCVSAARGNFVATRLSYVEANSLGLLVKKGDASAEVDIPFSEIMEVQIRHKDAAD
ncbi:MAG: hypothetical protein JXQ71_14275 [Verrucomicrobia bacterium]|nr:hypothetical protein [Verrucomicrobiota bacterium]